MEVKQVKVNRRGVKKLAKQLFQKVYKMDRLPYVSEIKATFPRFKASDTMHWEYLILKLLGYTATVRKPSDIAKENMEEMQKLLAENLKVFPSKSSSFPQLVTSFHYKGKNVGTLGYSNITRCWYCRVADGATQTSGYDDISLAFYRNVEKIVIREVSKCR